MPARPSSVDCASIFCISSCPRILNGDTNRAITLRARFMHAIEVARSSRSPVTDSVVSSICGDDGFQIKTRGRRRKLWKIVNAIGVVSRNRTRKVRGIHCSRYYYSFIFPLLNATRIKYIRFNNKYYNLKWNFYVMRNSIYHAVEYKRIVQCISNNNIRSNHERVVFNNSRRQ